MDSQNLSKHYDDNQESDHSQPTHHSVRKASQSSFHSGKQDNYLEDIRSLADDLEQTPLQKTKEVLDPDKDQFSDGERSSASLYSDEYDNVSPSEHSFSPRSPSPSPRRANRSRRVSSSPLQRTGVRKGISRRPGPHPHAQRRSGGLRSRDLGKDITGPPKDLDLVTRQLLPANLLKISELKNALAELQQRNDELQRENRLLRQLQQRHERALHRYNDMESKISQLLAQHNNETHALRERLRRSQEQHRTTEHKLREADVQLQRSRSQLQKLQKLADDQQLGDREELTRKLESATRRAQESERRVKELERNMELTSGSFQRQLANERRRTHEAQEEVQALQEEIERLSAKLKEKERELDVRNIYANRMRKATTKKELENSSKRKGPNRNITKAIQTEQHMLSIEFPSPPPGINDSNEFTLEDGAGDYLSLKERGRQGEEKQSVDQDLSMREEKTKKLRDSEWEKGEVDRKGHEQSVPQKEEETRKGCEQAQEEEKPSRGDRELLAARQRRIEEERRRKDLLLAKMEEIDNQTRDSDIFSAGPEVVPSPPQFSNPRNHSSSIFSFTELAEDTSVRLDSGGRRKGGSLRAQKACQEVDLEFGSYTPSFGQPARRPGLTSQNPNSNPKTNSQGEVDGLDLGGLVKERKSRLMEQLFGSGTSNNQPPSPDTTSKMEVLSPPLVARQASGGLGHRRKEAETPSGSNASAHRSTLHISESGPAVRAITSFDDEIEEVTL
ncbi:lebercilin [Chanos chanos]|uniref:Lebercilin n=1 Tax=Chanos chanos TaxID=29144 RepID=A0A6J2WCQ6_CHACN|nr:lebercilin [Chanos chanos]